MESLTKPFLKWAGGKGRLLDQLRPLRPSSFETYYEPFLGGGAHFFDLGAEVAVLSDVNGALIRAYWAIKDDVEGVISDLEKLAKEVDSAAYYFIRDAYNSGRLASDTKHAAVFIYLNRLCFNGLHRVNKRGHFNVPFGKYKNPRVCDPDGLRACSRALRDARICQIGFEAIEHVVDPGDFVYLDPPYLPASETANFSAYTAEGFGPEQQRKLANLLHKIDRRGARFMLSNADTPTSRELYAGWQIDTVSRPGTISSKGSGRGAVGEIVVRNYA